jgi:hypothetical protein
LSVSIIDELENEELASGGGVGGSESDGSGSGESGRKRQKLMRTQTGAGSEDGQAAVETEELDIDDGAEAGEYLMRSTEIWGPFLHAHAPGIEAGGEAELTY